jgi:hypothetical protein
VAEREIPEFQAQVRSVAANGWTERLAPSVCEPSAETSAGFGAFCVALKVLMVLDVTH